MERYEKCCYNCKHVTLESCKGCNTFGDTRFQNFELRDELSKLESGKFIELPCKIGDPIWVVYRDFEHRFNEYKIHESKCVGFAFENDLDIRIVTLFKCYDFDRVGNFTDKSEAEAKLRALQEFKNENISAIIF